MNDPAASVTVISAAGRKIHSFSRPAEISDALAQAERLHRQLRPELPKDYSACLEQMFSEGAKMLQLTDGGKIRALAIWRAYHTTYHGHRLYIDDLVVAEEIRGMGHGRVVMDWLKLSAKEIRCDTLALDCGINRDRSHKFYFREGFAIFCFGFAQSCHKL